MEGNGSYELQVPAPYLFDDDDSAMASLVNRFLIRSHPDQHVSNFKRPLYKSSEFCAACHKQTSTPGVDTVAGFAQEQNEKQYKQAWYDWEKKVGGKTIKKSTYIKKKLVSKIQRMDKCKCPVREILDVLGVKYE